MSDDPILRAEEALSYGCSPNGLASRTLIEELVAVLKATREARNRADQEVARCYGEILQYGAKLEAAQAENDRLITLLREQNEFIKELTTSDE